MAHASMSCPKCKAPMEEGFILDYTYGGRLAETWVSGPPERSLWTGIKMKGKRTMGVATWRCTACGYLESYAR